MRAAFGELAGDARQALSAEGFAPPDQRIERSADLRYIGQAFEVRVPCPDGEITRGWADLVVGRFHDAHRALYGYDFRQRGDQPVEWVNLRTSGIGPIRRPRIPEIPPGTGSGGAALGTRAVHFGTWLEAAVYDRTRLGSADTVTGPAIIQEFGATVPIPTGYTCRVDRHGNLLITVTDSEGT
jgi:N-methylhydantoinase A